MSWASRVGSKPVVAQIESKKLEATLSPAVQIQTNVDPSPSSEITIDATTTASSSSIPDPARVYSLMPEWMELLDVTWTSHAVAHLKSQARKLMADRARAIRGLWPTVMEQIMRPGTLPPDVHVELVLTGKNYGFALDVNGKRFDPCASEFTLPSDVVATLKRFVCQAKGHPLMDKYVETCFFLDIVWKPELCEDCDCDTCH
jgi:hypothetical protein